MCQKISDLALKAAEPDVAPINFARTVALHV